MSNNSNSFSIRKVLGVMAFVATAGFPAMAATSGSLALSGNVPAIIEISVTSEPGSLTLPLTTTIADREVATVNERSNKKAGYTVLLESASALAAQTASPALRSVESADVLPYSIKYDGITVVFTGGVAVVSDVSTRTNAAGLTKSVTVSFDGASYFLDESTYGDTLTFTIVAK